MLRLLSDRHHHQFIINFRIQFHIHRRYSAHWQQVRLHGVAFFLMALCRFPQGIILGVLQIFLVHPEDVHH